MRPPLELGGLNGDIGSVEAEVPGMDLYLLARCRLHEGLRPVALPLGSQRLLAFLAFRAEGVARDLVAGMLWPAVTEGRAHACLRSAIARVRRAAPAVISASPLHVSLADGVGVDLLDGQRLAAGLIARIEFSDNDDVASRVALLSKELLPGWYDDWVMSEAESWQHLRLHALESLSAELRERRRFAEAIAAASAAIAGDPFRESARAALIRVYLAEGNQSDAVRELTTYRGLIRRKLHLEPTGNLAQFLTESHPS